MLSQANKEIIATVLNVPVDELSGALSSENEVTLDLRLNGRVLSQDDERSLKESSVQQGKEIGYKEVARGLDISLDSGEKDPTVIAEKLKSTISTSLEDKYKNRQPTEELLDLQKKLDESEGRYSTLKGTYDTSLQNVEELKQKYTGLQGDIEQKEINNTILKSFPEKMKMDRSDALLIARNNFDFEQTENGMIVKRDGQIIQDPVGKPEKLDNVISSFVEEKKWIKQTGMNGSDRGGSGLPKGMSAEQAIQYISEAGKDVMNPEGSKMFNELTAQ